MSRHKARPPRAARGYDSAWERKRADFLRRYPLCELCRRDGVMRPAAVVDHIIPIAAGGERLKDSNLRSLCARHHNATKQSADRRGPDRGCHDDGTPRSDPAGLWPRREP